MHVDRQVDGLMSDLPHVVRSFLQPDYILHSANRR
jgi:hypothetical protein